VIVLSHARLQGTLFVAEMLSRQSYKDFDVVISHDVNETYAKLQSQLSYTNFVVRNDSDFPYLTRRFSLAKEASRQVIIYVDDDVTIPTNFVERCLEEHEPMTLKSWWAFCYEEGGGAYDRTRVVDKNTNADYVGTGIMVADGSIFHNNFIYDCSFPINGNEDMWLSYCATVLGYKKKYLNIDQIVLGGQDEFALYKQLMGSDYTKTDLLNDLRALGWQV
jgi:hypothetical protein